MGVVLSQRHADVTVPVKEIQQLESHFLTIRHLIKINTEDKSVKNDILSLRGHCAYTVRFWETKW